MDIVIYYLIKEGCTSTRYAVILKYGLYEWLVTMSTMQHVQRRGVFHMSNQIPA